MTENQKKLNIRLNIRQRKFIDGLFEGMTQTKAYIDAGYDVKDESVARVNASRLLTKANIQQEIDQRLNDIRNSNKLRLYRISEAALARLVSILQTEEDIDFKAETKKDTYLINIKANIIKDILDRVGLKLAEEHNVNLKGKVETDLSEEKKKEIVKLAYEAITGGQSRSGNNKK